MLRAMGEPFRLRLEELDRRYAASAEDVDELLELFLSRRQERSAGQKADEG